MDLDYIIIKQVCSEISSLVKSSQIRDVVAQGERGIAFILRNGHEEALIFSSDFTNSRLHLLRPIPSRSQNPDFHFHRTVRHHLGGAVIDEFTLIEGERIVELYASRKEFTGEIKSYRFIAELMGRFSNLILTDERDMIIAITNPRRRSESNPRDLRVGKPYALPLKTQRIPIKAYSLDDFVKFFSEAEKSQSWGKLILENFIGATPGLVSHISDRAQVSDKIAVDELSKEFVQKIYDAYLKAVENFKKNLLFPPFDNLLDINPTDDYPINRAVNNYYASLISKEAIEKRKLVWRKTVDVKIKSLERLLANLSQDILKAQEAEKYKLMGDLIYSFLSKFEEGKREVEVENIFSTNPDEKVKIRLLPGKDAVETAQEYHKRAKKLRRGEKEIETRIKETEKQLEDYRKLLEVPEWLEEASEEKFQKALEDIKGGKTEHLTRKKTEPKPESELPRSLRGENIHHYRSYEGHDIYVGGNDRANEALLKWGQPDDYWLHVKNMSGSHVLIPRRGVAIEFETILFAAELAVFHSQARGSNKVLVDYTLLKYVNKPAGAAPGFVIYRKEKSVRVDSPDEKKLEKRKIR